MKKNLKLSIIFLILGFVFVTVASVKGDSQNFSNYTPFVLISCEVFSVLSIYFAAMSGRKESLSKFVVFVIFVANLISGGLAGLMLSTLHSGEILGCLQNYFS